MDGVITGRSISLSEWICMSSEVASGLTLEGLSGTVWITALLGSLDSEFGLFGCCHASESFRHRSHTNRTELARSSLILAGRGRMNSGCGAVGHGVLKRPLASEMGSLGVRLAPVLGRALG